MVRLNSPAVRIKARPVMVIRRAKTHRCKSSVTHKHRTVCQARIKTHRRTHIHSIRHSIMAGPGSASPTRIHRDIPGPHPPKEVDR